MRRSPYILAGLVVLLLLAGILAKGIAAATPTTLATTQAYLPEVSSDAMVVDPTEPSSGGIAPVASTPTPSDTPTDTSTPTITPTPCSPTCTPTITPTPTNTSTVTQTPTPTLTPDTRFGMTVTGAINAPTAVSTLGITWWYAYNVLPTPGAPGTPIAEIELGSINHATPIPVATIQAAAQQAPGAYWIVGNEPNVPGPTAVSTDFYAEQLEYYANAIKEADPTAQIVGPNVLNWTFTCTGCGGYTTGQSFTEGIRTSYQNLYGSEPPIDVWSLHAYPITWDTLPMTNASLVEQQISGFSSYLSSIPVDAAKPIWLTEFGVLWGYDGITPVSSGCAQKPNCYAPGGSFDTNAVTSYLTTLLPWMMANGPQYRLQRWFIYTTIGQPLGFSTVYPGINLLNADGTATSFGQLYSQYSLGQSP